MSASKKVWFITGSSRGLGRSLAQAVLEAGDHLVATARNVASLNDLKDRYGKQVYTIALDVTSEAEAANAVQTAISKFGKIDVLVNNAGYGNINSIEDTSLAAFRAEIETNLFGTIIVTKAALPFMRAQSFGHVIQVSSVGGRIGPVGRGSYAAAKWGVEGFSEVLAKEVAPFGIKITIIEPGGFRTDFAGASSSIQPGLPAYESTVGATARFQQNYNGKQPGDPTRAAKVILTIANLEAPPLRLLLGTDALNGVEKNDLAKLMADQQWRHLSESTDFINDEGIE
jgi:NAD(P)-dependent dehydrogenase (short-subunit alcohol dehydrogenase family)